MLDNKVTESRKCICQREATHEVRFRAYNGGISKGYYCTTHAMKGHLEYGFQAYFIGTDEMDVNL